MANLTPIEAWQELREGNRRFVASEMHNPQQNAQRREDTVQGQNPKAVLFGCSDSRVAAEIIFDQGIGDLFVIRTAGEIIDTAVLGSIEFAISALKTPLIVVLGHDSCGAVGAALNALDTGEVPTGFLRDVVEKVSPSILNGRRAGITDRDELGAEHAVEIGELLRERSLVVNEAVQSGNLAIASVTYKLVDGKAYLRSVIGDIDESPVPPGTGAASS
ncbi:carbonic anhydrase [Dermacoccus barathri]|uniref:Carbonic anhydrase n=1 Tax=Dermacoccus barathri TaxID=322601 RepID=A0ABN2AZZ2_9MICO